RAREINMSMDDVITLASIVQKEDSEPDTMAVIASFCYNRLNSSAYPSLQSDATNYYVNTYIKPAASAGDYNLYRNRYSTYVCKGLPVGPICSPGDDAIKSVLWPASTNYYFFAHDDEGNLYAARTASEQNVNVYNALTASGSDDEEDA
ncbi:MAG: endolytic transglycosylase MltG, partial [Clostridia bacterium]|nr:endolytic transglycosylase MltG [Clostridia bacterium]